MWILPPVVCFKNSPGKRSVFLKFWERSLSGQGRGVFLFQQDRGSLLIRLITYNIVAMESKRGTLHLRNEAGENEQIRINEQDTSEGVKLCEKNIVGRVLTKTPVNM